MQILTEPQYISKYRAEHYGKLKITTFIKGQNNTKSLAKFLFTKYLHGNCNFHFQVKGHSCRNLTCHFLLYFPTWISVTVQECASGFVLLVWWHMQKREQERRRSGLDLPPHCLTSSWRLAWRWRELKTLLDWRLETKRGWKQVTGFGLNNGKFVTVTDIC